MTGATPQIFDLLPGPAGPSPEGQLFGGNNGAVGDGPLFANLLGGLLEGQPLEQNVLGLQQLLADAGFDQKAPPDILNPLIESDLLEPLVESDLPNPLVQSVINLPPAQKSMVGVNDSDGLPVRTSTAATESPVVETDSTVSGEAPFTAPMLLGLSGIPEKPAQHLIDNLTVGAGKIADDFNGALALLPEASATQNQSLKDIFAGDQVQVEPGNYRIIDSEVSNGQLNLTVVSPETPTEQIKLSLPLKTLLQKGSISPGRTEWSIPASAEPSLMEGPVLKDYISRLKLTSIQVETEVVSSAQTDGRQSVLKLFSGTGDRQLMMLSHLESNGFVGKRKIKQSRTDKVGGGSVDTVEALLDPESVVEAPSGKSTAARPWNDTLLSRLHPLAGKPDQKLTMLSPTTGTLGESADAVRMNELIGTDAKTERSSTDGENMKTGTTRLSLPEDVRTALKPGGQAVTLRMEPEHLGPARLRLSMHNNVLKALVTVDSTQAKLVVEGSLDQLTNQLSKADIQVERIEVALNSDSHHESFLHRRPRWQPDLKSKREIDAAGAITTVAATEDRYGTAPMVGTGGVNLLA